MNPAIIAAVRSVVQYVVAALITWLVALGYEVPAELVEIVFGALFGIVVFALNQLGSRFPIVNQIVSLGFSPESPSY
jgi:Na+/citrate or Na+/malate symporter